MNEILLFLVYKYKGDWNLVYKAIKNKEEIKEEEFNLFLNEKFKKEKNFITILDEQYPKKLLNIKQPPFVLFYKGNLNLLNIEEEFIYLTGSYETKSINEYINSLKNKDNITFINLFWNGLERKI